MSDAGEYFRDKVAVVTGGVASETTLMSAIRLPPVSKSIDQDDMEPSLMPRVAPSICRMSHNLSKCRSSKDR